MRFLSCLAVVIAADLIDLACAVDSSASATSTTLNVATGVGKAQIGSLLPSEISTGTEFNTPDATGTNTGSTAVSSTEASSKSREFYSTITRSNGMNIVLVNTIAFVTETVTGEAGSQSTHKYARTTDVTSTYYVLPTTITRSHRRTKTITVTASGSAAMPTCTTSSTPPLSRSTTASSLPSSTQITYCLNADENTKAPCSTTFASSSSIISSSSLSPANTTTAAAGSHMVNLSNAPRILKTAQYSSVIAAIATLFCIERLNPISLAFVVTDAFTQQGLGSLVFVTSSLLLYLSGFLAT